MQVFPVDGDPEVSAFREQSNEGQVYLGVYRLACLCVRIGSIALNHRRKLFLLSVTSPTSLLMIPSPQKKNDEDVGRDVMIDLSDVPSGIDKHILVHMMLCRSVYCAFHLISRQAVQY